MTDSVRHFLDGLGYGPVVGSDSLEGGVTSVVQRLKFDDGRTLVYKESVRAKPGMYKSEAEGLSALRLEGCPVVPDVLSVGEDHLLITDLGVQAEPPEGYWEEFGRRLAHLHSHSAPQFGYKMRTYLGTMLLDNEWTDDGHALFAETRLLTFLQWPNVQTIMTGEERRDIETLAHKLKDLIPVQGPSLMHGDLWLGNMLVANGGAPGLIDPAVYYGWPEADLALLPWFERIPQAFWDAYLDIHPLEEGWRTRLDILSLRDPLCMVAEYGDVFDCVAKVRSIVKRYVG